MGEFLYLGENYISKEQGIQLRRFKKEILKYSVEDVISYLLMKK
jgi:hypothetical protein